MNLRNEYYVYVYIDPRNYEEFYFGKGKGSRKDAHLSDISDSIKAKRIADIKKAGQKPIIRVIAKDLSEHDALLVEKTLLWKLGKHLTNISSGHYSKNFRPPNTFHMKLSGFDFQCGLYYYNVGESPHRDWDDYVQFGFISAGQAARFRDAMLEFRPGDVVAAYLKGFGFVGIGQLTSSAKPIREAIIGGNPLLNCELRCKSMSDNVNSDKKCEYVATVNWIKTVGRNDAKWAPKSGLFTTQLVRAALNKQPATIKYLEEVFGVDISAYIR